MGIKLLAYLLLPLSLLAAEPQEIFIRLRTEGQLLPIRCSFAAKEFSFSNDYQKQLERIFSYDLSHNGLTCLAEEEDPLYEIHMVFSGKTVELKLASPTMQKRINPVTLRGNLADDRKIIHNLSDKIYQTLFGGDPIAQTRILFTVRTKHPSEDSWLSDVYEADYDGAGAKKVTSKSGYCVTPAFIPPKEGFLSGSFLYVGYKTGQPKIYLATMGKTEGIPLVKLAGNQLMPAITRQRDLVAFVSDVTGNPDLFLLSFDSEKGALDKPRKIFTAPLAVQGTPTFSPDGKKIAFVSNKEGAPRVWVMDIPDPGVSLQEMRPKLLSRLQRECTAPAWSPDGKKIAYCSRTDGIRQIWVHDLATGEDRQLTRGPKNKENPSWSANSLYLVYNTSDVNDSELYVLGLKSKRFEKLPIQIPGDKHFPSWEIR